MPIQIEFEGQTHEFPDDFTDADITAALEAQAPAQARSTPPPANATIGMMAQSTAQGDPKPRTGADDLRDVLTWGGNVLGGMMGMNAPGEYSPGRDAVANPKTTLAMAALPIAAQKTPGIVARALGISKTHAGKNIEAATQAAKGVPVNPGAPGDVGLGILDYKGIEQVPRMVESFMRRVTDPAKGDLPFEEARRYYSAMSRMSVNQFNSLSPQMQRQVGAMREALHGALVESAETVGKGQQYASGIKEYSRASTAAKYGKKIGIGGSGLLGADYLLRRVTDALKASGSDR